MSHFSRLRDTLRLLSAACLLISSAFAQASGPAGGTFGPVVIDPSNPANIYTGSPNGGAFKTKGKAGPRSAPL